MFSEKNIFKKRELVTFGYFVTGKMEFFLDKNDCEFLSKKIVRTKDNDYVFSVIKGIINCEPYSQRVKKLVKELVSCTEIVSSSELEEEIYFDSITFNSKVIKKSTQNSDEKDLSRPANIERVNQIMAENGYYFDKTKYLGRKFIAKNNEIEK